MYAIRLVSSGVYTAKQAKNIPNIILNSLVDTLNVKAKVPHTLVLLINDSRFWNNTDILEYQMERLLMKFIKEIRRIIEARNLSLPPRAVNWDYPRIFITRALPLPNNMTKPYPKGFKGNRKTYNQLIQKGELVHNYRSIHFAEFTSDNANHFFAPDGTITRLGHLNIWATVSDAINKADNQDRIRQNKAKAKQLAMQVSITQSELQQIDHDVLDDTTDSDVELLDDNKQQFEHHDEARVPDNYRKRPIKRALLTEFNKLDSKIYSGDLPTNTHSNKSSTQGNHPRHHNIGYPPRGGGHHRGGRGKHFHKVGWRNKQW